MVDCYKLILGTQFGGRSNSSTIDVAMTFIHDVHSAWNQNKVMLVLTFNIKGFFDFVNHQCLLTKMQSRQIPLEYLKWTANFLDNHKVAICVNGTRGDSKPVKNRIPQGSLVLSILASFYSADLLEVFQDKVIFSTPKNLEADKPSDIGILIYIDNGKLTVSSISIATNNIFLAKAYKAVDQ